jgi:hypothetical protein
MNILCMSLTGIIALSSIVTVIIQVQTLCRLRRNTSHHYVIVRNWCAIGMASLMLLGWAQFLLVDWPKANAVLTLCALIAYGYLFWGPAMKHVSERTEGLNFARARGISNGSRDYWLHIDSHERAAPRGRPTRV